MPHTLSDFDYILPESLIAQYPAEPRDHSRLLVYDRKSRSITDDYFYNLPVWLPENSVLAINNSRVEKARLLFGKKEVFITRVIDAYTVEAMIRPGKAFRSGRSVELAAGNPQESKSQFQEHEQHECKKVPIRAEVLHIADDGLRTLRFNYPVDDSVFEPYRRTPFPPYIRPDETLAERYQTIYAKDDGSKAAPTAGLHFTDRIFQELSRKSIAKAELTLHVGLGTFAPVKTESISHHKMHSEWYRITSEAADKLRQAPHITAVGTTSARVLESAAVNQTGVNQADLHQMTVKTSAVRETGVNLSALYHDTLKTSAVRETGLNLAAVSESGLKGSAAKANEMRFRNFPPCEGHTDIFITPGYRFQAVDSLITNFHLPKSTLLMMIAAFTGLDEMHRIYSHAIREKYRFYSFGDAMLLL